MLEHDSQTCMCWSTIPRPVCVGARFTDLYVLEHDSQTCMCWSTIPRPVCVGARFPDLYVLAPYRHAPQSASQFSLPTWCSRIFAMDTKNLMDHDRSPSMRKVVPRAGIISLLPFSTNMLRHVFFLNLLFSFKKLNNCMRWGTLLYTCMRWGTLLLRVCAGARCSYAYALGHAAPRRMRCGTLLLLVCVGARFSQTYALGHDAPRRMRWGTLFRGVCVGARCF